MRTNHLQKLIAGAFAGALGLTALTGVATPTTASAAIDCSNVDPTVKVDCSSQTLGSTGRDFTDPQSPPAYVPVSNGSVTDPASAPLDKDLFSIIDKALPRSAAPTTIAIPVTTAAPTPATTVPAATVPPSTAPAAQALAVQAVADAPAADLAYTGSLSAGMATVSFLVLAAGFAAITRSRRSAA